MTRIILSSLILLIAIGLMTGGVWLAVLGGTWGFIVLGALMGVSSVLLLARRRSGFIAYAVVLLFAFGWGWWEVGFDWWALAPRDGLLVVFGLLLLLPSVVHSMRPDVVSFRGYGKEEMLLVGSLCVGAVVATVALLSSPHEIHGRLSEARTAVPPASDADVADGDWASYGRTADGQRYSPLTQITPQNVEKLEVAWEYHAGDIHADLPGTGLESTPLIVGDTLFLCTPRSQVIALDPVSGEERWRFDPNLVELPVELSTYATCRGLSYHDATGLGWPVSDSPPLDEAQARKLIAASIAEATTVAAGVAQNIVAKTAKAGAPNPIIVNETGDPSAPIRPDCIRRVFLPTRDARLIAISAETGTVCPGFGGANGTINLWQGMPNVTPSAFYSTSPPTVAGDVLVVGGSVNDNVSTTLPSGVIRAFDLRTGALRWNFDPGNPEATEPIGPGQTYVQNVPNNWSVATYDRKLDTVYLPMGIGSPDQLGMNRTEVHERLATSVLALDAKTGKLKWHFQTVHHDLWDYDVPAQPSMIDLTIDGQTVPALVQPTKQGEVFVINRVTGKPVLPVTEMPVAASDIPGEKASPTQPVSAISFAPKHVTGAQMWGMTPIDQMLCRIQLKKLRYEGRFTPPSVQGTLTHPGSFGILNWGAVAVDPNRQIMFAMPVYLGFTSKLVPRHSKLEEVVSKPGQPMGNENFGADYAAVLAPFMSPLGLPCQQPPWGYVAGVDLTTGETLYRHVNGTVRDMAPIPLPFKTGVPGIGGPIVTAGGLAFLSGTVDYYVRGYDLASGEEIWKARLPAGGQSTPATYLGRDGRQYLVVVAGGHAFTGTKLGDSIIAYALPGASRNDQTNSTTKSLSQ